MYNVVRLVVNKAFIACLTICIVACAPPIKVEVEEREVLTVRQQTEKIGGQVIRSHEIASKEVGSQKIGSKEIGKQEIGSQIIGSQNFGSQETCSWYCPPGVWQSGDWQPRYSQP